MKELEKIRAALLSDRTIDIVTRGAKSGLPRTTEIWFHNIDGRVIICGTPSASGDKGQRTKRDWLANLVADPGFRFCFKESLQYCLPAWATRVRDPADRKALMSAPQTSWYRERGFSLDELVAGAPIVSVEFTGEFQALNRASSG